jgi:hypothetical protein
MSDIYSLINSNSSATNRPVEDLTSNTLIDTLIALLYNLILRLSKQFRLKILAVELVSKSLGEPKLQPGEN